MKNNLFAKIKLSNGDMFYVTSSDQLGEKIELLNSCEILDITKYDSIVDMIKDDYMHHDVVMSELIRSTWMKYVDTMDIIHLLNIAGEEDMVDQLCVERTELEDASSSDPVGIPVSKYHIDYASKLHRAAIGENSYDARLRRIISDGPNPNADIVRAGEYGGYVENYDNLANEGRCWIYPNAAVCDSGKVRGNALVKAGLVGQSLITGNAVVWGDVLDGSIVSDHATVLGGATVTGHSTVRGNAVIGPNIRIDDGAIIGGNAVINSETDYINPIKLAYSGCMPSATMYKTADGGYGVSISDGDYIYDAEDNKIIGYSADKATLDYMQSLCAAMHKYIKK